MNREACGGLLKRKKIGEIFWFFLGGGGFSGGFRQGEREPGGANLGEKAGC